MGHGPPRTGEGSLEMDVMSYNVQELERSSKEPGEVCTVNIVHVHRARSSAGCAVVVVVVTRLTAVDAGSDGSCVRRRAITRIHSAAQYTQSLSENSRCVGRNCFVLCFQITVDTRKHPISTALERVPPGGRIFLGNRTHKATRCVCRGNMGEHCSTMHQTLAYS